MDIFQDSQGPGKLMFLTIFQPISGIFFIDPKIGDVDLFKFGFPAQWTCNRLTHSNLDQRSISNLQRGYGIVIPNPWKASCVSSLRNMLVFFE